MTHSQELAASAPLRIDFTFRLHTPLSPRGRVAEQWEHAKRSLEQGGKVFVATSHSGDVTFHAGYLSQSDAKKIDAVLNGGPENDKKPTTTRPEMSGPLKDYVSLHRHAMAQASLLDHTAIALRLAVAHMITSAGLWTVGTHNIGSVKDATKESVETSKAYLLFENERKEVCELLGLDKDTQSLCGHRYSGISCTEIFAKLLELSDKEVMRVMNATMADSLSAQDGMVEAIGQVVDIDMPTLWEPDEAFFEILRDKRVINAMVSEIAGERTAESVLTDTGKKQKAIISNRINGIGVDKPNTDWRPRWMQFPATSYLEADNVCPAFLDKTVLAKFKKLKSAHKAGKVKATRKAA